jgi:large subunit ribosomal protein L35
VDRVKPFHRLDSLPSWTPALIGAAFPDPWKTERPGQSGLPWQFDNVASAVGCTKETKMPKLKTKSGVKKRFKLTATGKIKHGVAGKRHRLMSHNAKYIRQNRGTKVMSASDAKIIKIFLPYGLS